jgi:polyhydroxybutyrate depolymerase
MSVLIIHGTLDPLVPYGGGTVGFGRHADRGAVLGAEATRDFWLKVDGLSGTTPIVFTFPHRQVDDPTRATRLVYGTAAGPQVELLTIERGGHVEPSLAYHYGRLYERLVGSQNRDFESAEEAWTFFAPKRRD